MDYINSINEWRRSWKTKTKYLSIVGCASEDEAIELAVKKAHSPSVARALKTNGRSTTRPRNAAGRFLAAEITAKLHKETFTVEEYDSWASEVCTEIRRIYREFHIDDYTFGNAQKLFNMAVKYVLSADNIDPALPIFKVAHIPIDGVIMKISKKKLSLRPMPTAWSKTDNLEDIISYQRRFRDALPDTYFPLLWECENWSN